LKRTNPGDGIEKRTLQIGYQKVLLLFLVFQKTGRMKNCLEKNKSTISYLITKGRRTAVVFQKKLKVFECNAFV